MIKFETHQQIDANTASYMESVTGLPLTQISIDDINEFIGGLIDFEKESLDVYDQAA
jgi:hypothetical protein